MGTASDSFIDLTERIGRKTGGLSVSPSVMSKKGSDEPVAYIMVSWLPRPPLAGFDLRASPFRAGQEGRRGDDLHHGDLAD